jgi:homoserine dehydrogenase
MKKTIRVVLCGLGNVGRAFLQLLQERRQHIEDHYGLPLALSAAVDIGGAAVSEDSEGLDLGSLCRHLAAGKSVETFQPSGRPGASAKAILGEGNSDVLVESTPTNLVDGEPGTTHIRAALNRGMAVVSANKGPLVLFYRELHELAAARGGSLHISAATAAALPTLDVGRICLAGTHLQSAEGILNGTTNYILTRMQQGGSTYDDALKEAQDLGIAETDPTYDVSGKDTANKTILIANRLFGTFFDPGDIEVEGITRITAGEVQKAAAARRVIKLLGRVEKTDAGIRISVSPEQLPADHPLAQVNGAEKAVSYLTDTMDRITVMGGKSSPSGAAAAILKDLINAYR